MDPPKSIFHTHKKICIDLKNIPEPLEHISEHPAPQARNAKIKEVPWIEKPKSWLAINL